MELLSSWSPKFSIVQFLWGPICFENFLHAIKLDECFVNMFKKYLETTGAIVAILRLILINKLHSDRGRDLEG